MEKILRKYKHLSDETFGRICKLAFAFVDGSDTYTEEYYKTDNATRVLFEMYIKKDLIKMMKQRKRNEKSNQKIREMRKEGKA